MIISQQQYSEELMRRVIYPIECCPMANIESTEIPYWLRALKIAKKVDPKLAELKKRPNQLLIVGGSFNKIENCSIHFHFLIHGTKDQKLEGKGFVIVPDDGHQACAEEVLNRLMVIAIKHAAEHGADLRSLFIR